ncbi:hypothetical protein BDP81DRAFT_412747 [Colletotrichum phormii]|uniref:Uncharacterized protein n=1 Tax=Colletotrichum phormii TaxID=359342 RepID=A0AAJ0A5N2_9PEZI|nr:uncharacterized protein BDP81DRAFT_412747 [Colletotrichum phormii]KAK1655477.1 hypothetical protein BDP81DRAFT_412747 [Colletotrichum phormii]
MHLRTYPLLLALSPDPRVHDAVMAISPSQVRFPSPSLASTQVPTPIQQVTGPGPPSSKPCRDLDARSARRTQEPVRPSLGQPTTADRSQRHFFFYTDVHFNELIPSLPWMEIHSVRPARLAVPYQRQEGNLHRCARIDGASVHYRDGNTVNPPPELGLDTHPTYGYLLLKGYDIS